MKNFILLVTILTLAMAMCGSVASMTQTPPTTIGTTIIFIPKPKPVKLQPRDAMFVPVTASYDDASHSIKFNFMENIGEMTISVINTQPESSISTL